MSHARGFIFLKTQKTAGTSMEIALSQFCGAHDIITPISKRDEKIRAALGGRGPQNYLGPQSGLKRLLGRIWEREQDRRFYNHMSASEVRARIETRAWHEYFKFCIERNPWDRVISLYHYWWQREPRPTLSEFIASDSVLMLKRKGIGIYTIEGEVVVDKILRYEDLAEETQALTTTLDLPGPLELPRAKSGYRKDTRHYREVLGDADQARIAEIFADEIRLLGYEY